MPALCAPLLFDSLAASCSTKEMPPALSRVPLGAGPSKASLGEDLTSSLICDKMSLGELGVVASFGAGLLFMGAETNLCAWNVGLLLTRLLFRPECRVWLCTQTHTPH